MYLASEKQEKNNLFNILTKSKIAVGFSSTWNSLYKVISGSVTTLKKKKKTTL